MIENEQLKSAMQQQETILNQMKRKEDRYVKFLFCISQRGVDIQQIYKEDYKSNTNTNHSDDVSDQSDQSVVINDQSINNYIIQEDFNSKNNQYLQKQIIEQHQARNNKHIIDSVETSISFDNTSKNESIIIQKSIGNNINNYNLGKI